MRSYSREQSDQHWQFERGGEAVTIQVGGPLRANNAGAVAEAALSGLGIALLPLYACAEAIAGGRLVHVLPGWTPKTKFGNQIIAVASPDRMRLSRNKCFLEFLKERRDHFFSPLSAPNL